MISFARNVTDSVKSHTPQLKALHSKSTPPHLSASGIRSVTRNDIHVIKSEQNSGGHTSIEVHPSYSVLTIFLTPIFLKFQKIDPLVSIQMSWICVKPGGSLLTKPVKVGFCSS